jgi:hypothetical protein
MVVAEEVKAAKKYWDETGLDMHIAVKKNIICVNTKHWGRNHYIITNLDTDALWNGLGEISQNIGRKLIESQNGPYVYLHKLNEDQTQDIFDQMTAKFGDNVERHMEWKWDISDAVMPLLI